MTNQFNPHEVARDMRAALPPPSNNGQKLTESAQQRWNRAIPEADYIQLGTLRYGVRLSNPNLLNLGTPTTTTTPTTKAANEVVNGSNGSGTVKHPQPSPTGSSSNSSSTAAAANKSCCCIGSGGGEIEMPWNSSYARTRLPVPSSLAKNRKSSPSTSASSSSSSAHQRLHQAQISIGPHQGGTTRGKLQYNNGLPAASLGPANKRTNNNSTSSTSSVDKQNTNRETSPASSTTVCCYSNNFGSASNKNAKNNNLVKVSNKYSDSKRLKIVNNKGEHKGSAQEDNDRANRNGVGYGNSRNVNEKWSGSFEYGAAANNDAREHHQRNFSSLVSSGRKDTHSSGGSAEGVVKQNDGDDLNLNFRDAQQQSKEPRLKDVNINNFKRKNISCDVYFGPNSSVGRTRNNNENNIRNITTTGVVAGDICTDELSSSPSLSPRSPSPLPLPPPSVVEPWLFEECVKPPPTPPIPPTASPHLSALSQNNTPTDQLLTHRDSDLTSTDFPPKNSLQQFNTAFGRNGSSNNYPEQRKCSLPVLNHTSLEKSLLQRKFSADNSRANSNSLEDGAVICHFIPKLQSADRTDVETRLQSLNRYCAKNLDSKPAEEAALEDFIFIDSSDISTTSEDIITVINEEDYHQDFHKFPSIPKIECALAENLYQSVCDSSRRQFPNSCSSDELSSVCSGGESAPTALAAGSIDDAKRNFNTIKYKQHDVVKIPSSSAIDGNQTNRSATPTSSEQYVTSSDSNNNRRTTRSATGEELKYNSSNNSHRNNDDDDDLSGGGGETKTISNNRNSTTQLKFNNLSPDNSSSSLNCFGKSQLYAKTSTEKLIMEKRSNTLDRLQKLVKKTTSGSSEGKSGDKHASTKTERLRELTELLKGTRAPPVPPPRRPKHSQSVDKSFERPNTPSSTTSLLNIDALHSEDSCSNLLKSKESRSIDIPYQFADNKRASTPSSPSCEHKAGLRANVSTSNLECLQGASAKDTAVEETKSEASFRGEDDFCTKLTRPESRTIVGSYTQKTIPFRSASFSQVDYSSGKYIRSALGAIKNSLMRNKESSVIDNVTLPRNKKDCRSCSPAQFSSTSEPGTSADDSEASKVSLKKTEISINLAPPDSYDRCEGLDGKEISSNRNSDIETIVEDPEAEHIETVENELINQKRAAINVVQASEMVLEPLVEEGVPIIPQTLTKDEECLQQATTCLIPVPVFDCVVSEWSTARPSEQWIDAAMTECNKLSDCLDSITEVSEKVVTEEDSSAEISDTLVIENPPEIMEPQILKLESLNEAEEGFLEPPKGSSTNLSDTNEDIVYRTPPVSIVCTEPDSLVSTTIIETPPTPDESAFKHETPDIEVVEVRKRHSNNEESGETLSSGNSEVEEKRRIDKSKRRKGIYIQWPAIDTNIDPESDSNDNCQPEDSWRPNKLSIKQDSSVDLSGESFTDLSSKEITSSPEKSKDCDILSRGDPFMLEPNTPDSDIAKPFWPKGHRRQSLTYQSSDEKDDSAVLSAIPVRSFKNIFLRSDSVSDNESERASSRDRTSASPAPSGELDLKRYSKRPLRGPYGQMLEAEMKKPSKVHYNEILEELSRHESSHSFPSFNRGRGSGSQSMDETNDRHSSKLFKPRKANLPLPSHSRTASSPSKLAELGVSDSIQTNTSKRHLGNIEQRSTDSDKSEKAAGKLETKKFSLDSHFSESHDKHSKRNSSGASDKHPKRSLDDTKLAQASRTPSERSFVLNTPDTPKGLVASPELLAELLKGSSEKLVTEQLTGATSPNNGSNALPTAVLKCLDTRTHVVVELFNTEKSYVESLQTIVLKYLNQLKSSENAGLVDTQTVDEIFFMVPAILNIHERFLEELRRRLDAWDPLQKIGDAFVDVFSRPVILDTYTSFVNNWNRAKDAIRTTRQKCPAFARFLEAMAREHKGKLSLDNLLIKPVQKFPNYELILSRLIKHTDIDHPDQKPLQEALKLVHDILLFLNCKEKEALENGQRETALRELEGVIEGMNDLVTPERAFLLFDLVSMPSGQTRKERGFFLFNDLLVITSIKRRSGTIRKTNMTCPGSVASTLDTNKYKFLTKISLDDLEIVKSKDENIRRIMKEIEHLSDDSNKLSQISELAASLRCPHQLLEEAIRDLQREVQRQLSERQTNDTQLNILELTLSTSNGIQNMTVVFSKPDKRSQWEEAFAEAKQKLASAIERSHIPDFLVSVPIRKTRAGLQFTCASPTLGVQRDVWVCNSDGYVGQVCVLSLVPEPTVTSCNGVCNARILCVASVPASDDSTSSSQHPGINISVQDPATAASLANTINSIVNSTSKSREKRPSKASDEATKKSNVRNSTDIQLDSDSSSEDSETESQPERTASPASQMMAAQSPVPPVTTAAGSGGHRHQESNSEETDVQQSTMWLGTEDGCIHVYNCTDNIRIKKNKIKISHISAVYSILYLSNKVFVSLANGDVCVYSRDHNGWNTANPITISVGTVSSPVTKLLNVHDKLWCAIQGCIKILNTTTLQIDSQIQISNDSKPITNMAIMNDYVWISVQNSAHLKCCHYESFEIIFEVNLAPSVNKMLSNCDDIIRQHKAACLRVTSLLSCKDLIWVGTSAGVLLTIAASSVCKGSSLPAVTGIPHGHTGHVRFLTFVESPMAGSMDDLYKVSNTNTGKSESSANNPSPQLLVISGGDGYEDFRSSGSNTVSEIAGREDSTNHLLLWQV